MYRCVPSHNASPRVLARESMTVGVTLHVVPAAFSWKMWNWDVVVSHIVAHQMPSLNQSLLSGFDPDGAVLAPENDWSLNPNWGVAALAVPTCTNAATSRSIPARPTDRARLLIIIMIMIPPLPASVP